VSKRSESLQTIERPLHIYTRGVNREAFFKSESDFERFRMILFEGIAHHKISVFCYTFMLNHYHLLLEQYEAYDVSRFMKYIGQRLSISTNRKYGRVGHLMQGRFGIVVSDSDATTLHLSRYIHMNPVSAKLVKRPEEWKYGSYLDYCGKLKSPIRTDRILNLCGGIPGYLKYMAEFDPSNPFYSETFIQEAKRKNREK
jgi:putative transposase